MSEDGLEGQWIEIVNIGHRSPKQFKRLRQLPTSPEELAALPDGEAEKIAREYIGLVVAAWNVLDPDTGTPLPPPSSPDLDTDAIPAVVSATIRSEIQNQAEELQNLKAGSRRA